MKPIRPQLLSGLLFGTLLFAIAILIGIKNLNSENTALLFKTEQSHEYQIVKKSLASKKP